MIKHILKDGRTLDDVTGHIVTMEDAATAYIVLGGLDNARKAGCERVVATECAIAAKEKRFA